VPESWYKVAMRSRRPVSLVTVAVSRPSTEKQTTQKQHGMTYDDGVTVVGRSPFMLILESARFSGKQCPEILPSGSSVVASHHSGGGVSVTVTTLVTVGGLEMVLQPAVQLSCMSVSG